MTPHTTGGDPQSLALYVHMPWCVRKCPYCDFNSHQLTAARPDASYVDTLLEDFEAELPWVQDRRIDTVFFGGGTPSLFLPQDFARLLRKFRERIAFADDVEVTLEANPGTIERGHFSGYREAGINRVSLGAQSFSPGALKSLGRIHSADDTHRAVAELKSAGIHNFNLDLMYALPNQSLEESIADVRTACALEPTHLSYYQLTLEPGTVFHARPPPLPDDESAWRIQVECQKLIAAAGYTQYEVSAYARSGFRCRHNLNYWSFGDYVGLGAGAHGKLSLEMPGRIMRTVKPKQPREYRQRIAESGFGAVERRAGDVGGVPPGDGHAVGAGDRHAVPPGDLPFEFMLNALRLNEGFTNDCFESRTGLSVDAFDVPMRESMRRGLVHPTVDGWRPTDLGFRFLNDLQSAFLK
jgi:oxygen-independent coproporphyrinogen-3 oxidase